MIRQAKREDLDNIELYSLGMTFYKDSNLPGSFNPAIFREYWRKFFDMELGVIFLFEEEGHIKGALGGLKHPDPYDGELVAQEMFWFVDILARKSRGAFLLYNAFEKWEKDNNAKRLCMACVCNKHIEAVRKFYERKGFKAKDISFFKQL